MTGHERQALLKRAHGRASVVVGERAWSDYEIFF
jgi:hypothetical protein